MTAISNRTEAQDERFMRRALALAERGRGYVSPNPLVGAVLVRKGKIIAEGWHRRFGGHHAEVECIRRARGDLSRATLYVNLEPCSHFGKTPPCVDRIIEAGIRQVVVAMPDPNPLVAGAGIGRLRASGIRVHTGVLTDEATELNRFFVKHISTGVPYVHVKMAVSLDGYIGRAGTPRRLSSRESLRLVHAWRGAFDAVLVGAGTIKADDPRFTTRLERGRDPDVIILDGKFTVSPRARVFRAGKGRRVFLCVDKRYLKGQTPKAFLLESKGVRVLCFHAKNGLLDIREVLADLYPHHVGSILVEGGSVVFAGFLNAGVVDEMSVFVSPLLLGEGVHPFAPMRHTHRIARPFHIVAVRQVGGDLLYTLRIQEGETRSVYRHH